MSEPFGKVGAVVDDDVPRKTSTFVDDDVSRKTSAFLPVLILGVVMLVWFGFQATQLNTERDAMRNAMASQDKQVQDSKKLRDSLDAVARGTAQLADAGNPNARLIVDELKKHGVTITPNQPTTGATPPTP